MNVDGRKTAQFLRLDPDGTGAYRIDSRWVAICEWKTDANDRFTFRTAEYYGMIYTLNGSVVGDTIRGKLALLDHDGAHQRWAFDGAFVRLDAKDRTREFLGVAGGLYSKLDYLEDAGDVVGTELFVGIQGGRLNIALGEIQGSVFELLPAHDIERSGDTVVFRIGVPPHGEWTWRAVFKEGEVALRDPSYLQEVDGRLVRAPRWLTVPRADSLATFFRPEVVATCPR